MRYQKTLGCKVLKCCEGPIRTGCSGVRRVLAPDNKLQVRFGLGRKLGQLFFTRGVLDPNVVGETDKVIAYGPFAPAA